MFNISKPSEVKFPFMIDYDPGCDRGMPYPPHTHGLTEIGMPEFLMDPLAFQPRANCARINMSYEYFSNLEHASQLNAILSGETIHVMGKDLNPEYLSEDQYTYCFREVTTEFEVVKQAYPHEIDPGTRFILIYIDGDDFALTDDYYRGETATTTNDNLNKEGRNTMDNIKIFNFKEDWNLVKPYLNDPKIQGLLDKGMSEYAGRIPDDGIPYWDGTKGLGPWAYARLDLLRDRCSGGWNEVDFSIRMHLQYKSNLIRNANEFPKSINPDEYANATELVKQCQEIVNKAIDDNCKRLDAYIYYQCLGADRELAPWQKEMAEQIYPEYKWNICDVLLNGRFIPNTIIGTVQGVVVMIFDILKFDNLLADDIAVDKEVTELPRVSLGSGIR